MTRKLARLLPIFCLIFISSIFIIGASPTAFKIPKESKYLNEKIGEKIVVRGFVCKEEEIRIKNRRLNLCLENDIQVLISTNLYPEYKYGDFLEIEAVLEEPKNFDDFDYSSYLSRHGIDYLMHYPRIKIASGNLNFRQNIYKKLLNFKKSLKEIINIGLPEPESGLANAILLGYRRAITIENLEIFSRSGLSHLVAISGAHISILSALLLSFFSRLGFSRLRSLRFILCFLIIYPILTGLSASAIRASIMGSLSTLALYNGRLNSSPRSLLISASLMLAFNPLLLRHDIGFQLSFAAVLGIMTLYPILEKISDHFLDLAFFRPRIRKLIAIILSALNISLVSQIMTLPLMINSFKQISLVSPLANILVVWIFPYLFIFLLIAIFLSFIFPGLILFWFLPVYICLNFVFKVAESLAAYSGAIKTFSGFSFNLAFIYYSLIFLLVFLYRKRQNKFRKENI